MADEAKQPEQPKETDFKELKGRFTRDLEAAKKYMDPIHQLMDKNYEMYRNRWSDNATDFQISDLYAYVETVVPILTNNRTRATVKAEYPDYIKHAEGMNFILDHTFDVNNWDYNAQRIARMAEIYRSAIAYTGYDAEAKNGTGQLCIKEINIRWCYLDSSPIELQESGYFFYVEPMRTSKVIQLYPDKAEEIKATVGKREGGMGDDKKNSGNWFQSWVRTIKNAVSFNPDKKSMQRLGEYQWLPELDEEEKRRGSVAFIHYWYRDEETDKWKVSFWADDVPLEDMDNPFIHEKLPYAIYSPTEDILSSMGIPMAEHIENLNYEKNVLMDQIVLSAKRAVDPPLLYNTAAGLKDPQAIREKAKETGTIGINNPDFAPLNSIADFVNFPQLPAFVDNLPERYSVMEDRITGVNDSFRGLSDATSGKEVQLKQEAAYTRIKTKVDNFEKFVKALSEMIIVNAMQFSKETRAYRVKGDYSKFQDMGQDAPFEAKPIQTGADPQGQPVHDNKEFFLYANPHEWTKIETSAPDEVSAQGNQVGSDPAAANQDVDQQQTPTSEEGTTEEVQKAYRILQMTVEIEAGSSLPTSPMARKEEASELFKAGAIDQMALLDAYDYPGREAIIQRMQEAAQAQQKAEMEAQQAQAQQQMQVENMKMEQQAKLKQMEMDHQKGVVQMNNDAKANLQQPGQQPTQQPGQQPTQQPGQQPTQQPPDVAGGLDKIRAAMPELKNLSDEELMAIIAQMQVPQPA